MAAPVSAVPSVDPDTEASLLRNIAISSSQSDKENSFAEENMKASRQFKILSDEAGSVMNKANNDKQGVKKVKKAKRRSLATLQQSAEGKGILTGIGRSHLSIKDAFMYKAKAKVSDYNNVDHSSVTGKISVKKTPELSDDKKSKEDLLLIDDALALMKRTDHVEDSYWESIAEERRLALDETLQENEQLYDEIDKLTDENRELKRKLNDAECYKLLYLSLQEQTDSNSDFTDQTNDVDD